MKTFRYHALSFIFILLTIPLMTIPLTTAASRDLVPPQVTGNSVEICLNSRLSYHSGLSAPVTDQQLSNVLWAAGRAPVAGGSRTIYLIDNSGTYIYHPATHSLSFHSSQSTSNGFRITYDVDQDFDAGVSYTFALAAGVSTWTGTEMQLASCPMMADIVFGTRTVRGLTSERVAVSSDETLPDPVTDGDNQLEDILATVALEQDLDTTTDLTPEQLSQLLWGGYGCTPHTVNSGRAGLTVPSSWASYYMTERIYVVTDRVQRFCNRQGSQLTTRDHRMELVLDSDVRAQVQSAVADLTAAPCYIVLCPEFPSGQEWYSRLEVGFLAGGVLLEAETLALGCDFRTELTSAEQTQLQSVLGIPATHTPFVVLSLGQPISLVTPTPVQTPVPTVTPTPQCIHSGDANLDGSITAGDAQMTFFITLGMVEPAYLESCAADCNGDGSVTAGDAQEIFMMTLGSGQCID